MRPKLAEVVSGDSWEILEELRAVIAAMPGQIEVPAYLLGVRVDERMAVAQTIPNCHVMTRAIAEFYPVNVHDGFVFSGARRLEHSWLTMEAEDPRVILDPWPLGVVSGPALFLQDYAFHFGPECSFLSTRSEEFQSTLNRTIDVVRNILLERFPKRILVAV